MNNEITAIDWMQRALKLAKQAKQRNEVPVGAVLVLDGEVIGEGWNQSIAQKDPTAHAEIIALRAGAAKLNNYRLVNSVLYVTLEPCAMCVGAMIHARINRLVFGAYDAKAGAVASVFNLLDAKRLNHHFEYQGGVLAQECGELLTNFFAGRRL